MGNMMRNVGTVCGLSAMAQAAVAECAHDEECSAQDAVEILVLEAAFFRVRFSARAIAERLRMLMPRLLPLHPQNLVGQKPEVVGDGIEPPGENGDIPGHGVDFVFKTKKPGKDGVSRHVGPRLKSHAGRLSKVSHGGQS